MSHELSKSVLVALQNKYWDLAELRAQRETYEDAGIYTLQGDERELRSQAMKRIADIFPGALRELELMDSTALRARAQCIGEVIDTGAPIPLWLRVSWEFHLITKWLLRVKAHGKRKHISQVDWESLRELLLVENKEEDSGALEWLRLVGVDEINRYLAPHQGRMVDEIWLGLSKRFDKPIGELQALVLGGS